MFILFENCKDNAFKRIPRFGRILLYKVKKVAVSDWAPAEPESMQPAQMLRRAGCLLPAATGALPLQIYYVKPRCWIGTVAARVATQKPVFNRTFP
jgi:hypothetical protein